MKKFACEAPHLRVVLMRAWRVIHSSAAGDMPNLLELDAEPVSLRLLNFDRIAEN
jgi:hypothetical protein